MTAPRPRTRQPKQLDAGILQAEISSFGLHLAADNKSAKTIRTYIEGVHWFAAAQLLGQSSRATGSARRKELCTSRRVSAAEGAADARRGRLDDAVL